MKKSKIHIGVILFEMTMIVTSLAALVFFILSMIKNAEPFDITILFTTNEGLLSLALFGGVYALFLFIGFLTLLSTLICRKFIGLLYVIEFAFFGLINSICFMLTTRLANYADNGFIIALVSIILAGVSLLMGFIMLIVFFVDCHKHRLYLKEKRLQKKLEKAQPKNPVEEFNEEQPVEEEVSEEEAEESDEEAEVEEESETEEDEVKVQKLTRKENGKIKEDEPEEKAKREYNAKVYHVSQHPTTNKWQVKLAKGEKALKLFNTQAEALAYAKEVAKKQGGSVRLHSRKGKMRSA